MTSPFTILENAQLTFTQVTATTEDPATGNQIPSAAVNLVAKAYFKKVIPIRDRKTGADTNTFNIEGFATDPNPLPDWIGPELGAVDCWIQGVGNGSFTFESKLHVAKDLVESVTGNYIQGTFVKKGGGNEAAA
jgi:hypothetical protein